MRKSHAIKEGKPLESRTWLISLSDTTHAIVTGVSQLPEQLITMLVSKWPFVRSLTTRLWYLHQLPPFILEHGHWAILCHHKNCEHWKIKCFLERVYFFISLLAVVTLLPYFTMCRKLKSNVNIYIHTYILCMCMHAPACACMHVCICVLLTSSVSWIFFHPCKRRLV